MQTIRIYRRGEGLVFKITANKADCERLARQAGWTESHELMWLR